MILGKDWSTIRKLMVMQGAIGGMKAVEDFATGNPVVFQTDLSKPLKKLAINLLPVQDGTGDPSPENIRPLLPWGEVGTWTGGKNLLDINQLWDNGENRGTGEVNRYYKLTVPNGKYTVSTNVINNTNPSVASVFATNALVTPTSAYDGIFLNTPRTITVSNNELYIFIRVSSSGGYLTWDKTSFADYYVQVESGQTATPYEPPSITPHPVNLTGITPPVYGASLDLTTGEVWGTYKSITLNGNESEAWSTYGVGEPHFCAVYTPSDKAVGNEKSKCNEFKNQLNAYSSNEYGIYCDHSRLANTYFRMPNSSVTTLEGFKAWIAENPIQLVYELSTPVLLATITPQQISAIVGVNTVWSDANGQIEVTFLKRR